MSAVPWTPSARLSKHTIAARPKSVAGPRIVDMLDRRKQNMPLRAHSSGTWQA